MLKIQTYIDPVEVNGVVIKRLSQDEDQLIVSAHRIHNSWVVLEFQEKNVTVSVRNLERAIQNAKNHD